MEYNKLVSITGMGGLYELLSSKADGGIVRSLQDNTSKFVSNRIHQFSHLESIEIFTTGDNVNLVDIFTAMEKSDEKLPDPKASNEDIKNYLVKVYPEIDIERVYVSDMKKMVKWYTLLKENNVDIKMSEAGEEHADEAAPAEKKTATKIQAPKSAAPKSAPVKKINTPRKMA